MTRIVADNWMCSRPINNQREPGGKPNEGIKKRTLPEHYEHRPRRGNHHQLRNERFPIASRGAERDRAGNHRNQGHRRGRLHLWPADRDELRGHVRLLPWTAIRASSRRRSIRSRTKPASSPTRTRRSSRPTATRRILSPGWTSAPSRSCCRSRRWRNRATTR